jgi:hypothetical protein
MAGGAMFGEIPESTDSGEESENGDLAKRLGNMSAKYIP